MTAQADPAKVEAAAERVVGEVNAAMTCLNIYVGDRLGLFEAMVELGPCTSEQLANHKSYDERYVREWLHALVAGEYIAHKDGEFSLSPEYATVLANPDDPAYATPFTHWLPSVAAPAEQLIEAFPTGAGVPYEAYGQAALTAIGDGNKPMFVHDYAASWIPALPDIHAKLEAGARVADIGCGTGWSSISLAKGFPKAKIDALDLDKESIRQANENANEEGVADRVTFHLGEAAEAQLDGTYDLVTAFECIHDMAYPIEALRQMHDLVADDGAVLVADEAANDSLDDNINFLGQFFYNFSILHCLPQSRVFPDGAETGTAIGPATLTDYAKQAGFSKVDVLPIENAFWRFYRLTP